jgi:four helix bundle protein
MGDGEDGVGAEQARKQVQDFTDLRVWQAAMDLGERLYRVTWTFPRNETYGLAGQIQRASVSVPSNIAEGHTRESLKEYLNFLSISRSSLSEIRTQIAFARRLGYLNDNQAKDLEGEIVALARQLTALRNALRRRA